MTYRDLPLPLRGFLALLPLLGFLLYFSVMILVTARRKWRVLSQILSGAMALLSLFHLFALLCYEVKDTPLARLLDTLPNILTIMLSFSLFGTGLALFLYFAYRKRNFISLSSFQDAYDAMEAGVCFYDEDGTVFLVNRYLVDFSERYLNTSLLNAKEFVRRLEAGEWEGKSVPFGGGMAYKSNDGEVYMLGFSVHEMEGREVNELSLTPISELYRLTLELVHSNAKLAESNKRLRELGEEIAQLKKEEENLLAKKRIHDDLGGLLLYAQSCLDKDLNEKEKAALLNYLEYEAKEAVGLEKKEVGEGLLEELEKAGDDIGVKVSFKGEEVPKEEEIYVYESAKECLLNAYAHGKAKHLDVSFQRVESGYLLSMSNDGEPLSGEVREGSGLSALRSLVESKGDGMEIETSPNFKVEITMRRHL